MHELLQEAPGRLADVVRLRRSIHREPELGLDLPLTQAKVLAELREVAAQAELRGTVRFMYQPGEEGYGGARVMLEEGLLDGYGGHPRRISGDRQRRGLCALRIACWRAVARQRECAGAGHAANGCWRRRR